MRLIIVTSNSDVVNDDFVPVTKDPQITNAYQEGDYWYLKLNAKNVLTILTRENNIWGIYPIYDPFYQDLAQGLLVVI